jgi:long-chain fatty acid transport protein
MTCTAVVVRLVTLMLAVGCALAPVAVQAGGLYITEFGQPSMGTSGAGSETLTDDASVAFTIPAGITKLDKAHFMVTGMVISTSVEFDQSPGTTVTAAGSAVPGSGSNGGDAGSVAVGGAFFYARPIGDRWGFGVAVNSVSGAVLEYEQPDDFVGRYWAQKSSLLTISVTPSVAYKVSENFAVAFSLPVTMGVLELDVALPAPTAAGVEGLAEIEKGKDVAVTGSVSFLWDVTERSRLGLTYLGESEFDFDGDLKLTLPGGGSTPGDVDIQIEFTLPQTIRMGGSLDVGSRTTLLASVAWEEWSALGALPVTTPAGSGTLSYDWEDTWRYALGARIRGEGKWTWYTGISLDTDVTSATKRTLDLPVDQQIRLSGGATFKKGEKMTLGGALTLADLGDSKVNNGGLRPVSGTPWQVEGDFSTNRGIFAAFNVGWN